MLQPQPRKSLYRDPAVYWRTPYKSERWICLIKSLRSKECSLCSDLWKTHDPTISIVVLQLQLKVNISINEELTSPAVSRWLQARDTDTWNAFLIHIPESWSSNRRLKHVPKTYIKHAPELCHRNWHLQIFNILEQREVQIQWTGSFV